MFTRSSSYYTAPAPSLECTMAPDSMRGTSSRRRRYPSRSRYAPHSCCGRKVANHPKFWWMCELFYVVSNMAIKGSIAVMLLRLTVEPTHRIIVWTTLVVTEVFSAGFLFFFLFQCWPSQYFYTRYTEGEGSCVDPKVTIVLVYVYSAIICICDGVYAILPCVLVYNLQMPRTQKTLVGFLLAMGAMYVKSSRRLPVVVLLAIRCYC